MGGDGTRLRTFCGAYLRTMDPERAAGEAGIRDGFGMLAAKYTRRRLKAMRDAAAGELRREDAVRRLAQMAFGRANDAVGLALKPGETDPAGLDLSAVSEIKVTDKGGVEIKFIDRVRALEALCGLLDDGEDKGAAALLQVLTAPAWDGEDGDAD